MFQLLVFMDVVKILLHCNMFLIFMILKQLYT